VALPAKAALLRRDREGQAEMSDGDRRQATTSSTNPEAKARAEIEEGTVRSRLAALLGRSRSPRLLHGKTTTTRVLQFDFDERFPFEGDSAAPH
jgi:hypothetical protein